MPAAALVRNLRPYEANRISIDAAQLPLDTHRRGDDRGRAGLAQRSTGAPASVERVRVASSASSSATVRRCRRCRRTFQAGADFPVGLDGHTYVTGYDHGLAGEACWPGGRCLFRVPPPPLEDPLPQRGDIAPRGGGEAASSALCTLLLCLSAPGAFRRGDLHGLGRRRAFGVYTRSPRRPTPPPGPSR
jgi:hypothetical protein